MASMVVANIEEFEEALQATRVEELNGLLRDYTLGRQIVGLQRDLELLWPHFDAELAFVDTAYANGRIPKVALRPIPGGYLEAHAAATWLAMRDYIGRRHGVWIRPTGSNSSYRAYAVQVYFRQLYESGRGNVAAIPGTSNHGWGRAVDVATPTMALYIRRYGARFGWNHDEGARVGEWWHMGYVGGGSTKRAKPDPYKLLAKDERRHAKLLDHWRAEMRRQEKSGRGPKWQEALERARDQKDWLIRRKRKIYNLAHGKGAAAWAKANRGARHQIISKLVD